jgi:hypothetical protein
MGWVTVGMGWLLASGVLGLEEEEEEAVFIRGVNTNEDSPNAQHVACRIGKDLGF